MTVNPDRVLTARIIVGLVALFWVLMFGVTLVFPGCTSLPAEAAREEEQFNAPVMPNDNQSGLLWIKRKALSNPVPPVAHAAHIPDVGKMAPEREYAVFDGILCEMVRGQWRPKPPGTPWGTHTICISEDSHGNVTVRDVLQEAK